MLIQGQVGQINASDGVQNNIRQGRTGEVIASQAHARFYEQTSRGQVFTVVQTAITSNVAQGHTLVSANSAVQTNGTVNMALWNPVGSGVNLSLLKWTAAPISGTLPQAAGFHGVFVTGNPTNPTTADTSRGAYNNLVGGKQPIARYISSTSGTAITGGTAPVPVRVMNTAYQSTAFTQAAGASVTENIDGDIVIPPGYGWVPLFFNNYASFLASWSLTWEEVPI